MRQRDTRLYQLADVIAAMLAWTLFFLYRKWTEGVPSDWQALHDLNFYYGIFIIPMGWFLFYSLFDQYSDVYRMARLTTLARTFFLTLAGVVFLFFTLLLDDQVPDYTTHYASFAVLFGLHFTLTATGRMLLLTRAHRRLQRGDVAFPTLLIGSGPLAASLFEDISGREKKLGYHFSGYLEVAAETRPAQAEQVLLAAHLPRLGHTGDLAGLIRRHCIEDVIVAIEPSEHSQLKEIMDVLFDFGEKIHVRIIPDIYDILLGHVRMSEVYGAVLIQVRQELMPKWERLLKRLMDVGVSAAVLLLFSWLYLFLALRVRLSSPGPVLFWQERVGFQGKSFQLVKFRSMRVDAEQQGPQLSQEGDPRCTPWGLTMRKYRLDELPNFWNVLVGDMSLVGPRPERQFFIDQILEKAPHYRHLMKVRPGITSWGQVKYGYASSLPEMLQRLRFDILYIENMSLSLDFKIIFYTLLVLVRGSGR